MSTGELFPRGLAPEEAAELDACVERARPLTLQTLMRQARDHVARARAAFARNPLVDIELAQALLAALETLVKTWDAVPAIARSWCKGMILYFAAANEDENDFESPVGFDDDAEVVNACLRMAGREDLCVNLEGRDGAA